MEQLQGKELIIHADDYMQTFGVTRQVAYRVLKKAVVDLFRAEWGYKFINKHGKKQVAYRRFVQAVDYIDDGATVLFKFADDTVPMLIELEKRFTTYEIEQVAQLSSQYAMRLYEFFMQHLDKKTGKGWLDISLDELRFRFGLLPTEYKEIKDFKRRVLDFAMKQILALPAQGYFFQWRKIQFFDCLCVSFHHLINVNFPLWARFIRFFAFKNGFACSITHDMMHITAFL